jgi:DNA-binding response OmpR family regulator
MAEILLVDDDAAFLAIVAKTLAAEGFSVASETSPRKALERAKSGPRLIILDLVMPGLRGLDVCQRLKQEPATAGIPVLILTGNDKEGQEVACLDMGADDYLLKPVKSERLLAHCRALLRRSEPAKAAKVIDLKGLSLDHARKRVVLDGKTHDELTPKEFELLYFLAGRPTQPQDRATLYREVWGAEPPSEIALKTVEVHVRRVRLKLRLPAERWLVTVAGRGYALTPPK